MNLAVQSDNPIMCKSLELILRYYLISQHKEEKPEYLSSDLRVVSLSNYWNKCISEMERMKGKNFSCGVSLYDIFVEKNLNNVSSYAKNDEVIEYYKSDVCKNDYPIYVDLIVKKLECGQKRGVLLDKLDKLKISPKASQKFINSHCKLHIASYLFDNDLHNLIGAAIPETEVNQVTTHSVASDRRLT